MRISLYLEVHLSQMALSDEDLEEGYTYGISNEEQVGIISDEDP